MHRWERKGNPEIGRRHRKRGTESETFECDIYIYTYIYTRRGAIGLFISDQRGSLATALGDKTKSRVWKAAEEKGCRQ